MWRRCLCLCLQPGSDVSAALAADMVLDDDGAEMCPFWSPVSQCEAHHALPLGASARLFVRREVKGLDLGLVALCSHNFLGAPVGTKHDDWVAATLSSTASGLE